MNERLEAPAMTGEPSIGKRKGAEKLGPDNEVGMRTIIAGPRDFTDAETLNVAMRECGWIPTVVLSGKCRGVDALGEAWALERGIPVEEYPADWNLGKKAGPIRNELMGKRADSLVALWDGISTGTGGMIGIAKRLGLRYYVHRI